jgi:NitT/TauT family transport system substrate-binding protein
LKDISKGGTVEIRQVANADIKALLDRGDIHGAIVPEPWGSILIKDLNAKVILDYNKVWREGNYSSAVVIARKEFVEKNPEIIKKIVKTHVELTDYINNNQDEARSLLNSQINKLTKKPLAEDILKLAFGRLILTNNPEMDSVVELGNLAVEAGFLKEKPDLQKLFNLSILNNVLKETGKETIN